MQRVFYFYLKGDRAPTDPIPSNSAIFSYLLPETKHESSQILNIFLIFNKICHRFNGLEFPPWLRIRICLGLCRGLGSFYAFLLGPRELILWGNVNIRTHNDKNDKNQTVFKTDDIFLIFILRKMFPTHAIGWVGSLGCGVLSPRKRWTNGNRATIIIRLFRGRHLLKNQ